jgi:molybdate transport system ATP-binding protein
MTKSPALIRLENVAVALEGRRVLMGLNWALHAGESWAVLGQNGSGKSTLLKLLRGELWPAPGCGGRRIYAFDGVEQTTAVGIKEQIALVSPEAQSRYRQQEWTLTGLQVVYSGFCGGDYAYQRLTSFQQETALSLIRMLGLQELVGRNVQTLSTGELRRVLIARALTASPRVLVCDEICDGLDAQARAALLSLLERVCQRGTQLLYTSHREEELLPSLTHRLRLEGGRIVESGPHLPAPTRVPSTFDVGSEPAPSMVHAASRVQRRPRAGATRIRINSASVFHELRQALIDIELEIRSGEHWAILGPNGSGKSTLLKLIGGELHPAWGGRVQRFEFTARNTLWEIRRRIGSVSPELQSTYRERLTGAQVIASGFFSSVGLLDPVTPTQRKRVARLMADLRLEHLAARNTLEMSYGEFRRILLARALVHRPELLLFDEPFDGLDSSARREMAAALAEVAQGGTGLIVVSHHPADLPPCTTHVVELEQGRIAFRGRLPDYLSRARKA